MCNSNHFSLKDAAAATPSAGKLASDIFQNGAIEIQYYAPKISDPQQPHRRDEVYIIAQGSGVLEINGEPIPFGCGDMLLVPADAQHKFSSFTEDFGTWVIFHGP